MKNTIALAAGMGPAVLDHLRQFGDLPPAGIVAGQAVDSAITDLFGAGGGVYNDVDIFRNVPGGTRRGRVYASNTASHSQIELKRQQGYGAMALVLEVMDTYFIKSVSRKGHLNFVNCSMADGFMSERLSAQQVLSGFDLNCTRVGVDLATGALVWDRHYEEFLRSRQLRITMMHTPWHTFLRLAKKREELPNVFVDLEAAAQACVGVARSSFIQAMRTQKDVSLLFGTKHHELAEQFRSSWSPYFELEQKAFRRRGTAWVPEEPGIAPAVARPVDELSDEHVSLWQLAPRGELPSVLQQRCNDLGKGILFFASRVVDESRRVKPAGAAQKLEHLTQQRREASHDSNTDYVLYSAKVFGTDFVQGQALPDVANKLAAWLDKHSAFAGKLFGLTLAQQHERMLDIQAVARQFGKEFYEGDIEAPLGVLELSATPYDLLKRERMLTLLERDFRKNTEPFKVSPLALPVTLPAEFAGFKAEEMLTPDALRREGQEMEHCVGGYSHAVTSGRSRILRIRFAAERKSKNCSTVELHGKFSATRSADMAVVVAQNRTVKNKAPSAANQAFVEFLVGYLTLVDELTQESPLELAQATCDELTRCESETLALRAQATALKEQAWAVGRSADKLDKAAEFLRSRTTVLRQLAGAEAVERAQEKRRVERALQALADQEAADALLGTDTAAGALAETVAERHDAADSTSPQAALSRWPFWFPKKLLKALERRTS